MRLMELMPAAIEGGFWADRQRLNRDVLIPDGARRLEEAGNFGNLRGEVASAAWCSETPTSTSGSRRSATNSRASRHRSSRRWPTRRSTLLEALRSATTAT